MYLIDSNIIIYSYQVEYKYLRDIIELLPTLLPDQSVFDKATEIRKMFNLKLADSLIAATAMENQLAIYTRNLSDFERVDGLKSINPVLQDF